MHMYTCKCDVCMLDYMCQVRCPPIGVIGFPPWNSSVFFDLLCFHVMIKHFQTLLDPTLITLITNFVQSLGLNELYNSIEH